MGMEVYIEEPLFVFLTSHASKNFNAHIASLNVDLVFEKPLSPG
jgi:hypothetical protein